MINKILQTKKSIRYTLFFSGTFSLSIGIIGIFVPILPTTPFLLLSAACYARSSERAYSWLLRNRWFGDYILNYREKKGISIKNKAVTITLLWITITASILFFIDIFLIKLLLLIIAILVTIHILLIKTKSTTSEKDIQY